MYTISGRDDIDDGDINNKIATCVVINRGPSADLLHFIKNVPYPPKNYTDVEVLWANNHKTKEEVVCSNTILTTEVLMQLNGNGMHGWMIRSWMRTCHSSV
uniref:uncharacterized protein LOC108950617 n=1 Tax=Ciona intestinalis TaxID=7719 RepID=UPI000EF482CF|nr:uncharacterized protein LOC108950617 [Ciona intestinalis]|eukprot:XP_026695360.1 uncharacterized protein LOC108950617 [Ciona intestinalis]